jgi:cell division protease FtsH
MEVPVSAATAEMIDSEIRRILDEAYEQALNTIKLNRRFIECGAERLLTEETLDESQVEKLCEDFGLRGAPKESLTNSAPLPP